LHDVAAAAAAMQVLPVADSDVSATLLLRGTDGSIWQLAWPHITTASARGTTATATLLQQSLPSDVSSIDVSSRGESQFIIGFYPSDNTIGSSELLLNTDADSYLLQSTQAVAAAAATATKSSSSGAAGAVCGWRRPAAASISSTSSCSARAAAPLRTATGLCVRVVTAAHGDSAVVEQQQQVLEVTAVQATNGSKQESCVWRHIAVPAADGEVRDSTNDNVQCAYVVVLSRCYA
jgi:hypothetical protein